MAYLCLKNHYLLRLSSFAMIMPKIVPGPG
jgi:hypothetical protein